MQVILLEKIRNLGALGDTVQVKPGYARNYLIPEEKAVQATKDNVAYFNERRAELEKKEAQNLKRKSVRRNSMVLFLLLMPWQAMKVSYMVPLELMKLKLRSPINLLK